MVGFKVGQKVVYPNHGIGTIEQIEQKQIGAVALPFYTLRLAATNSLVLVPVSNAAEVGLRRPISTSECETLFGALAGDFATPANDWKDRFKDFSDKKPQYTTVHLYFTSRTFGTTSFQTYQFSLRAKEIVRPGLLLPMLNTPKFALYLWAT